MPCAEPETDVIGLVFPVFYATNDCGIPLIITAAKPVSVATQVENSDIKGANLQIKNHP